MSLWTLDTDHVSLVLAGHPQVSRRVAELGADVAITVVSVQELFNGWVVRINQAKEIEDFVRLSFPISSTPSHPFSKSPSYFCSFSICSSTLP